MDAKAWQQSRFSLHSVQTRRRNWPETMSRNSLEESKIISGNWTTFKRIRIVDIYLSVTIYGNFSYGQFIWYKMRWIDAFYCKNVTKWVWFPCGWLSILFNGILLCEWTFLVNFFSILVEVKWSGDSSSCVERLAMCVWIKYLPFSTWNTCTNFDRKSIMGWLHRRHYANNIKMKHSIWYNCMFHMIIVAKFKLTHSVCACIIPEMLMTPR